jgi:hypothetical protein
MTHASEVPAAITRAYPGIEHHPVIVEVFRPDGTGWRTLRGRAYDLDQLVAGTYRKRITVSYARALRRDGVTAVAVDVGGRAADFLVADLLSRRAVAR